MSGPIAPTADSREQDNAVVELLSALPVAEELAAEAVADVEAAEK